MLCIPKNKIEEFKKALKNKDLDVFKLMKLDSAERTKVFERFAGKDAKTLNLLFEKKLILKNKIQGIKNWISKVGEVGRYDPKKQAEIKKMLEEYKRKQTERLLNPKEDEGFLSDLVEQKLGVHITREQAKVAFDIQKQSEIYLKDFDGKNWKNETSKAKYGASKVMFKKYIDNLKNGRLPIKGILKSYSQEIKQLWKEDRYEATKKILHDSVSNLSKTMINAVASWDNSFMGRQGAITLIKSPKVWWKMARNSLTDFYKTMKGQSPEDVLMASVYSHPDYINGNFEKAKLNFGIEEEVPIQALEKLPYVGKIFKASDTAFIDSAIRARIGLWDMMKKVDEAKGFELDEKGLQDRGTIINAITARGKAGRIIASEPVKLLLWAPRMMKADWDILTGHTFGFGLKTKLARIEAAKTITNLVIATAAISAIAQAMGADVEKDPRSTDFLKIKIGNTRINTPFARGIPQIVVLLSRLITRETKSSTGIIHKLNSGEYGSKSLFDVGIDFLVNKTTPPVGAGLSYIRGRDFAGRKPKFSRTLFGFLPISVQNFIGLKDNKTNEAIIGAFLDLFGFSSNTYSQTTDWGESTGKELLQFREKVGEEKFKQANDLYNKQYTNWLLKIKKNPKYIKLSNEDKQKVITAKKIKLKHLIYRKYHFTYKKAKKNRDVKSLSK